MKLKISKEECLRLAELEGDSEVGVGPLSRNPGLCSCRLETVNSASIDPPDMILDPWCPVHGGKDPDQEYERQRDDAVWDTTYERDMDFE